MNKKYDNLADKTSAEMVAEHMASSFGLIKSVHPECGGFSATVTMKGDNVLTSIDLLVPKEEEGRDWNDILEIH